MPFYESSKRPSQGKFKRLQFIVDLIGLRGLNYDAVAALLGLSRPIIYTAIREDDMLLSRAEAICEVLDSSLTITLSLDPGKDGITTAIDPSLMIHTPYGFKLKRLAFLSLFMARYGISRGEIARRTGLSPSTVATWFQNDDIKISRLFQVIDAIGASIRVDIDAHEKNSGEEQPSPENQRSYVINIRSTKSVLL